MIATVLDVIIGPVTFSGSLIAAGKLQGWVSSRPVVFPGARLVTAALAVIGVGASCYLLAGHDSIPVLILVTCAALGFGVTMTMPIGGADMPVVIALLNSFTGIAVAIAGFVIDNGALIIGGALVGASGGILTLLMARAMNRSVLGVMMGGFGTGDSGPVGGRRLGRAPASGASRPRTPPSSWPTPARSSSSPATAWPPRRPSTRRPRWPRCCGSTPRCSSPSTRWQAGCLAT